MEPSCPNPPKRRLSDNQSSTADLPPLLNPTSETVEPNLHPTTCPAITNDSNPPSNKEEPEPPESKLIREKEEKTQRQIVSSPSPEPFFEAYTR